MQLINYGLQIDQNKIQRSHINKQEQFIIFFETVSFYYPGCLGTHSVVQAGLDLALIFFKC